MTGSSRTRTATVNNKRVGSEGSRSGAALTGFAWREALGRQLEGWQPGLLAVFVAGVTALLAVPRPVPPSELPAAFVEPREIDPIARADSALARQARRAQLDTEVRQLGSALRAYNLADATDDAEAVGQERRAVAEAAATAAKHGPLALAELRAYELEGFLRELKRWEATGVESDELRELGGPFVARATKNGWTAGRTLLPSVAVRSALFKKRWSELTMIHSEGLALTPVEQRVVLAFVLEHPPIEATSSHVSPRDRAAAARAANHADQYRLRKIEELRALDPRYPADLALGVVHYRLRHYPMAVEAIRRHLDAHPDGPYTLRAQNYLSAALDRANDAL